MELNGLLFFPVTPFDRTGAVDVEALRAHVDEGVRAGAGAVFAACGTGEGNTLGEQEVLEVARTAIAAADGRVPVLVGVGGPVAGAAAVARKVKEAGADGLLLLPPYLVSSPQAGLVAYIRAVTEAARLPVIVYQRGSMVFTPETAVAVARLPHVVGIKDGIGDVAAMQAVVAAVHADGHRDFLFFNGLPTAELTMRPYRAIGVARYSSAVFAFAPDIALAFYDALDHDDDETVERLLQIFFLPFAQIRDRQRGYAVALVKAMVRAGGRPVSGVRPPFVDPDPEDLADLQHLIEQTRAALAAPSGTRRSVRAVG